MYSSKVSTDLSKVYNRRGGSRGGAGRDHQEDEPEAIAVKDAASMKEALELASLDAIKMWFPKEAAALQKLNPYFAAGYKF